jgi:hypothetical protein
MLPSFRPSFKNHKSGLPRNHHDCSFAGNIADVLPAYLKVAVPACSDPRSEPSPETLARKRRALFADAELRPAAFQHP